MAVTYAHSYGRTVQGAQLALTCGRVPQLRRQSVSKSYGWDAAPRSAWRAEDAALDRAEWLLLPPEGICAFCPDYLNPHDDAAR